MNAQSCGKDEFANEQTDQFGQGLNDRNNIIDERSKERIETMEKKINGQAVELERNAALYESTVGEEVVEKREECAKHYHLGGNRYQAVLFAEPVHFRAEGEKDWQAYDNNLEEFEDERGRKVLRNKANPMRVELPEQADGEALVRLTHKGRTLSWKFASPVNAVRARVKQGAELKMEKLVQRAEQAAKFVGRTRSSLQAMDETELEREVMTAQERRADLTNKQARAEYEDVLPGVSVVYHLEGAKVKEDIVLADAGAVERAALILPDEYDYTVNDDQSVSVQDKATAEELFHFEPPVVYDAAEAPKRTLAEVSLTPQAGGMRLIYKIDADFLAAAAYPVTIDPVVRRTSDQLNIRDIWMAQDGGVSGTSDDTLRSGVTGNKDHVSLMHLQKLAKIKSSDTIIQAVLQLYCRSAATSTNHFVEVHQLKRPWAASTANWTTFDPNDGDNVDLNAADYAKPSSGAYFTMDITNMYRDWYRKNAQGESLNYGLLLRKPAYDTTDPNYITMGSSEIEGTNSKFRPMIYVNYVSHAGVQGWWSYETQSIGRGGTAYVDRFNGNLIYEHSDTRMTGNLLPVSVTHYYNSCLSGDYDDKNRNYYHCGFGWKLSVQQWLSQKEINGVKHISWIDGSGTEHWFEFTTYDTKYKDLEGMGYTLTRYKETTSLPQRVEIEDRNGVIYRFQKRPQLKPADPQWSKFWLVKIKNVQDITSKKEYAQVDFQYVSPTGSQTMEDVAGMIASITDPAQRVTQFFYVNNLLDHIMVPGPDDANGNPTTRMTSFEYDSYKRLVSIIYNYDGEKQTKFCYDDTGVSHLLRKATNFDQTRLEIGFESLSDYYGDGYVEPDDTGALVNETADEQMLRVKSLEYIGKDVHGAKQLFNYKTMRTEITAVDGTTSDAGKVLTYQFSDAGAVVAVHDELGYAQFNEFGSKTEAAPEEVSRLRKVVVNRLRAPHFDDISWHYSNSARDADVRCMGMRSLKITGSGSCYQDVALEAGDWSFSCYAKVDSAKGGASISADSASSEELTDQTPSATANPNYDDKNATRGWERLHVSFHLGSASTVRFTLKNSTGTAYFACPQVEEGKVPNSVNLLSNGDFRATSGSLPVDWEAGEGIEATDHIVSISGAPSHVKGNAMHMVARPSRTGKTMKQLLYVSGDKGDTFVVGGWANGKSVPNLSGVTRSFSVGMRFLISKDNWSDDVYKAFNAEWVGWQYGCHVIKAPVDYLRVEFFFSYGRNCNEADFTNLFLYREPFGKSFEYDDKRRVTSAANRAGQKAHMEYDSYDNLTSYRQPGRASGETYTMTYGTSADDKERKLMRSKKTPAGLSYTYDYDNHGNLTKTKLKSGSSVIATQRTYTANGNYPENSIDSRGHKVTTTYEGNTGRVMEVVDQRETDQSCAVKYGYDDLDRVTSVSANGSVNSYSYQNDRLQTVSHNTTSSTPDVSYAFGYNDLGQQTTVRVGGRTLSTNEYKDDRSHLLESVTYGNGQKVEYEYDAYDRLQKTSAMVDSATVNYTYEYGANGKLSLVKDDTSGRKRTQFTEYDLSDRPIQKTTRDDGNNSVLYRTNLQYDKFNNLSGFAEKVGANGYTTSYAYDVDNRPTTVTYDGGQTVKLAYDGLNRVTTRTAKNGVEYLTDYAYKQAPDGADKGDGTATPLVTGLTQPNMNFEYEYYKNGNIKSEKRNTEAAVEYQYDGLGQLLRVNDKQDLTAGAGGTTWVYGYDLGGNITQKAAYAYTTGTPSGAQKTYAYQYNDSTWKDKLTGISVTTAGGATTTQSVGYPASGDIGNPTSFATEQGNWTLAWQRGRQLKSMSKSGMTVSFQYDANGLRTQKNAGGTITEYTLHGKLLTHLVKGSDWMHIYYDAQSRPAMVNYNGTVYTYVHNLQGDIVGIVDNGNNLVVEYRYDAWGKLLETTGSLKTTLGYLNPFRYRGYVYDEETGLYYLRTRYYNPEWARFVNSDSAVGKVGSPLSHNAYAYCDNSPIVASDPDGKATYVTSSPSKGLKFAVELLIGIISGIEPSGLGKMTITLVTDETKIDVDYAETYNMLLDIRNSAIAAASSAVVGAAFMPSGPVLTTITDSAVVGFVGDLASDSIQDYFTDLETIRPGYYMTLTAEYERTAGWLFPYTVLTKYEIRLYPDYAEVWMTNIDQRNPQLCIGPQKVGDSLVIQRGNMDELGQYF